MSCFNGQGSPIASLKGIVVIARVHRFVRSGIYMPLVEAHMHSASKMQCTYCFYVICLMYIQASPACYRTFLWHSLKHLRMHSHISYFLHFVWMLRLFPCAGQTRQFILMVEQVDQWWQLTSSRHMSAFFIPSLVAGPYNLVRLCCSYLFVCLSVHQTNLAMKRNCPCTICVQHLRYFCTGLWPMHVLLSCLGLRMFGLCISKPSCHMCSMLHYRVWRFWFWNICGSQECTVWK